VASDAEARRKLEQALRSLEGQASALERLRQSTERVDGEYTSLLVLLQQLRTRVSVVRTAGDSTQLEGLRDSVQRLNTELEAITDALESVQREGLSPVSEISEEDSGPRPSAAGSVHEGGASRLAPVTPGSVRLENLKGQLINGDRIKIGLAP
jgi:hypothetical protein